MFREIFVGISVGVDKSRFGFFDNRGAKILNYLTIDHDGNELTNDGLADELVNGISQLWEQLGEENKDGQYSDLLGTIGLGIAGLFDAHRGIIESVFCMPKINNLHIFTILQKKFGGLVFLLSDADAAIVGEYNFGAGRDTKSAVMLLLGSSVGSAVLVEGKLQRGMGRGGNWGHTTMAAAPFQGHGWPCRCGLYGCIETYLSTNGLYKLLRDFCFISQRHFNCQQNLVNFHSTVDEHLKWNVNEATLMIQHGVEKGCQICKTIVDRYADYLVVAIGNIACVHNPECIILGGEIAGMGKVLTEMVNKHLKRRNDKIIGLLQNMHIKVAELPDAGIMGAAKYAIDSKIDYMQSKKR